MWAIIKDTCEAEGISIPTINELNDLLDEQTYDIYAKGLTCTINQADSDFATGLAMRYKPHSVSEMSAFVAIIRPGCASLLQDFIDRKPYTTGVPELDNLLIEGNHRMIYQELIMKYLIWLGIPETGSYDIIKKIAKKKFKEEELAELKVKLKDGWIKQVGKEDGFAETFTVVEQAARYSFNASHSLSYAYDSLYGAYLKSHYPLEYYTVALNYCEGDAKRTTRLTNELKSFNIDLRPIKFRYSRGKYSFVKDENVIYKSITSVKDMNYQSAEELYALRNNTYNSFADLLFDIKKKTILRKNQIDILISLDYFSEFGDANYLAKVFECYQSYVGTKQVNKSRADEDNIPYDLLRSIGAKETDKMFRLVDDKLLIGELIKRIKCPKRTMKDSINAQIDYLGYVDIKGDQYRKMLAVIDVDTKYAPRVTAQSLKSGNMFEFKISKKIFNRHKLERGDVFKIIHKDTKPKTKYLGNGEYEPIPGTSETWLQQYEVVNL